MPKAKKAPVVVPEVEVVTVEPVYEEVLVKKRIFYDFLSRPFCRSFILIGNQLFRLLTTFTLLLMITNFFSVIGAFGSCSWTEQKYYNIIFGFDVYTINFLSLIVIGVAWFLSFACDANAAEQDARASDTPSLFTVSIEGALFTVLHQTHFVAYVVLSNTLFECSGPYMIALKLASVAYVLVIVAALIRIPISFYRSHRSYFTLHKKVQVLKKVE